MIKYSYTIQYVPDVEEALNFYTKALGLERKFISPEKDYGELITGETTLAFASFELGENNIPKGYIKTSQSNKPFGVEFVFVVDDVQATVDIACTNGAELEVEAREKPWGQTVAYVRDVNGYLLEICTAIESDS